MARTLPWKKQGAPVTVGGRGKAKSRKHVPASPSASEPASPSPASSPSSSRPAPLPKLKSKAPKSPRPRGDSSDNARHQPPRTPKPMPESFMIPGLQNDDHWRMVEDEFVAVAHKFTAHLHAAEYERLKDQAKDQNADAIRSLSRPVTGPMTDRVKRRHAVIALKQSQSSSINKARKRMQADDDDDDAEDGDELPWAGTSLEGLMDSPRKKRVSLARMVSAPSDTRAAALSRKESAGVKSVRRGDGIQQTAAPTLNRERSVHFQDNASGKNALQGKITPIPSSRTSVKVPGIPSSSSHTTQRASSAAPARAVKAPLPVRQEKPLEPAATLPDDDSDSSVDFGFKLTKKYKKR